MVQERISLADLLYQTMLNENFAKSFGIKRETIVLSDKYANFEDRDIDKYQGNKNKQKLPQTKRNRL